MKKKTTPYTTKATINESRLSSSGIAAGFQDVVHKSRIVEELTQQRRHQRDLSHVVLGHEPLREAFGTLFSIGCSTGDEHVVKNGRLSRMAFKHLIRTMGITTATPYWQFKKSAVITLREPAEKIIIEVPPSQHQSALHATSFTTDPRCQSSSQLPNPDDVPTFQSAIVFNDENLSFGSPAANIKEGALIQIGGATGRRERASKNEGRHQSDAEQLVPPHPRDIHAYQPDVQHSIDIMRLDNDSLEALFDYGMGGFSDYLEKRPTNSGVAIPPQAAVATRTSPLSADKDATSANLKVDGALAFPDFVVVCVEIAKRMTPPDMYPPRNKEYLHVQLLEALFMKGDFIRRLHNELCPKVLNPFKLPPTITEVLETTYMDVLATAFASATNPSMIVPPSEKSGGYRQGSEEGGAGGTMTTSMAVDDVSRAEFFVSMYVGDVTVTFDAFLDLLVERLGIPIHSIFSANDLFMLFQRYDASNNGSSNSSEDAACVDFNGFILILLYIAFQTFSSDVAGQIIREQREKAKEEKRLAAKIQGKEALYNVDDRNNNTSQSTATSRLLAAYQKAPTDSFHNMLKIAPTVQARLHWMMHQYFLSAFPVDPALYYVSWQDKVPRVVKPMSILKTMVPIFVEDENDLGATTSQPPRGDSGSNASLNTTLTKIGSTLAPQSKYGSHQAGVARPLDVDDVRDGADRQRSRAQLLQRDIDVELDAIRADEIEVGKTMWIFGRGFPVRSTGTGRKCPVYVQFGGTSTPGGEVEAADAEAIVDVEGSVDAYTVQQRTDQATKDERLGDGAFNVESTPRTKIVLMRGKCISTTLAQVVIPKLPRTDNAVTSISLRVTPKSNKEKVRAILEAQEAEAASKEPEEVGQLSPTNANAHQLSLMGSAVSRTVSLAPSHISRTVSRQTNVGPVGSTLGGKSGVSPKTNGLAELEETFRITVESTMLTQIHISCDLLRWTRRDDVSFTYKEVLLTLQAPTAVIRLLRTVFTCFSVRMDDVEDPVTGELSLGAVYIGFPQWAAVCAQFPQLGIETASGILGEAGSVGASNGLVGDYLLNNPDTAFQRHWLFFRNARPRYDNDADLDAPLLDFADFVKVVFTQFIHLHGCTPKVSDLILTAFRRAPEVTKNHRKELDMRKSGFFWTASKDPIEAAIAQFEQEPAGTRNPLKESDEIRALETKYNSQHIIDKNRSLITLSNVQLTSVAQVAEAVLSELKSEEASRACKNCGLNPAVRDPSPLWDLEWNADPEMLEAMNDIQSGLIVSEKAEPLPHEVATVEKRKRADEAEKAAGLVGNAAAIRKTTTSTVGETRATEGTSESLNIKPKGASKRVKKAFKNAVMSLKNRSIPMNARDASIEDEDLQRYIFKALASFMETLPPEADSDEKEASEFLQMSYVDAMKMGPRGQLYFISALLDRFISSHHEVLAEGEQYFQQSVHQAKKAGKFLTLQLMTLQRSMEGISNSLDKVGTLLEDAFSLAGEERNARLSGRLITSDTLWVMLSRMFTGIQDTLTYVNDLTRPYIAEDDRTERLNVDGSAVFADNFRSQIIAKCLEMEGSLRSRVAEASGGPALEQRSIRAQSMTSIDARLVSQKETASARRAVNVFTKKRQGLSQDTPSTELTSNDAEMQELRQMASYSNANKVDRRELEHQRILLEQEMDRRLEDQRVAMEERLKEKVREVGTTYMKETQEASFLLFQLMKYAQEECLIPSEVGTPVFKFLDAHNMKLRRVTYGASGRRESDVESLDSVDVVAPPSDVGVQVNEDELPSVEVMQAFLQGKGVKNYQRLAVTGTLLRNAFNVGKAVLGKYGTNPIIFEEFSKMVKSELQFTLNPSHRERIHVPTDLANMKFTETTTNTELTLEHFVDGERYAGLELRLEELSVLVDEIDGIQRTSDGFQTSAKSTRSSSLNNKSTSGKVSPKRRKGAVAKVVDASTDAPAVVDPVGMVAVGGPLDWIKVKDPEAIAITSKAVGSREMSINGPTVTFTPPTQFLQPKNGATTSPAKKTQGVDSVDTKAIPHEEMSPPFRTDAYYAALQQRMIRRAVRVDAYLLEKMYRDISAHSSDAQTSMHLPLLEDLREVSIQTDNSAKVKGTMTDEITRKEIACAANIYIPSKQEVAKEKKQAQKQAKKDIRRQKKVEAIKSGVVDSDDDDASVASSHGVGSLDSLSSLHTDDFEKVVHAVAKQHNIDGFTTDTASDEEEGVLGALSSTTGSMVTKRSRRYLSRRLQVKWKQLRRQVSLRGGSKSIRMSQSSHKSGAGNQSSTALLPGRGGPSSLGVADKSGSMFITQVSEEGDGSHDDVMGGSVVSSATTSRKVPTPESIALAKRSQMIQELRAARGGGDGKPPISKSTSSAFSKDILKRASVGANQEATTNNEEDDVLGAAIFKAARQRASKPSLAEILNDEEDAQDDLDHLLAAVEARSKKETSKSKRGTRQDEEKPSAQKVSTRRGRNVNGPGDAGGDEEPPQNDDDGDTESFSVEEEYIEESTGNKKMRRKRVSRKKITVAADSNQHRRSNNSDAPKSPIPANLSPNERSKHLQRQIAKSDKERRSNRRDLKARNDLIELDEKRQKVHRRTKSAADDGQSPVDGEQSNRDILDDDSDDVRRRKKHRKKTHRRRHRSHRHNTDDAGSNQEDDYVTECNEERRPRKDKSHKRKHHRRHRQAEHVDKPSEINTAALAGQSPTHIESSPNRHSSRKQWGDHSGRQRSSRPRRSRSSPHKKGTYATAEDTVDSYTTDESYTTSSSESYSYSSSFDTSDDYYSSSSTDQRTKRHQNKTSTAAAVSSSLSPGAGSISPHEAFMAMVEKQGSTPKPGAAFRPIVTISTKKKDPLGDGEQDLEEEIENLRMMVSELERENVQLQMQDHKNRRQIANLNSKARQDKAVFEARTHNKDKENNSSSDNEDPSSSTQKDGTPTHRKFVLGSRPSDPYYSGRGIPKFGADARRSLNEISHRITNGSNVTDSMRHFGAISRAEDGVIERRVFGSGREIGEPLRFREGEGGEQEVVTDKHTQRVNKMWQEISTLNKLKKEKRKAAEEASAMLADAEERRKLLAKRGGNHNGLPFTIIKAEKDSADQGPSSNDKDSKDAPSRRRLVAAGERVFVVSENRLVPLKDVMAAGHVGTLGVEDETVVLTRTEYSVMRAKLTTSKVVLSEQKLVRRHIGTLLDKFCGMTSATPTTDDVDVEAELAAHYEDQAALFNLRDKLEREVDSAGIYELAELLERELRRRYRARATQQNSVVNVPASSPQAYTARIAELERQAVVRRGEQERLPVEELCRLIVRNDQYRSGVRAPIEVNPNVSACREAAIVALRAHLGASLRSSMTSASLSQEESDRIRCQFEQSAVTRALWEHVLSSIGDILHDVTSFVEAGAEAMVEAAQADSKGNNNTVMDFANSSSVRSSSVTSTGNVKSQAVKKCIKKVSDVISSVQKMVAAQLSGIISEGSMTASTAVASAIREASILASSNAEAFESISTANQEGGAPLPSHRGGAFASFNDLDTPKHPYSIFAEGGSASFVGGGHSTTSIASCSFGAVDEASYIESRKHKITKAIRNEVSQQAKAEEVNVLLSSMMGVLDSRLAQPPASVRTSQRSLNLWRNTILVHMLEQVNKSKVDQVGARWCGVTADVQAEISHLLEYDFLTLQQQRTVFFFHLRMCSYILCGMACDETRYVALGRDIGGVGIEQVGSEETARKFTAARLFPEEVAVSLLIGGGGGSADSGVSLGPSAPDPTLISSVLSFDALSYELLCRAAYNPRLGTTALTDPSLEALRLQYANTVKSVTDEKWNPTPDTLSPLQWLKAAKKFLQRTFNLVGSSTIQYNSHVHQDNTTPKRQTSLIGSGAQSAPQLRREDSVIYDASIPVSVAPSIPAMSHCPASWLGGGQRRVLPSSLLTSPYARSTRRHVSPATFSNIRLPSWGVASAKDNLPIRQAVGDFSLMDRRSVPSRLQTVVGPTTPAPSEVISLLSSRCLQPLSESEVSELRAATVGNRTPPPQSNVLWMAVRDAFSRWCARTGVDRREATASTTFTTSILLPLISLVTGRSVGSLETDTTTVELQQLLTPTQLRAVLQALQRN